MALVLLGPGQVVGDGENVTWGPRTSRVAVWVGGRGNEAPGTFSSLRPFEIPAAGPPQLCCGLWLFIPM